SGAGGGGRPNLKDGYSNWSIRMSVQSQRGMSSGRRVRLWGIDAPFLFSKLMLKLFLVCP
ncbi:Unknown protein, partial [Striga hermonthica]